MVRVYFTGQVLITPKPTAEIVSLVNDTLFEKKFYYNLENKEITEEPKGKRAVLHWTIDANNYLGWDGNSDFDFHFLWLKYLMDNVFIPNGYICNGGLSYSTEIISMNGFIKVENNKILLYDVSYNNEMTLINT